MVPLCVCTKLRITSCATSTFPSVKRRGFDEAPWSLFNEKLRSCHQPLTITYTMWRHSQRSVSVPLRLICVHCKIESTPHATHLQHKTSHEFRTRTNKKNLEHHPGSHRLLVQLANIVGNGQPRFSRVTYRICIKMLSLSFYEDTIKLLDLATRWVTSTLMVASAIHVAASQLW